MRFSPVIALLSFLSLPFLIACGASKEEGIKGKGQIVGKVEQILYHGRFNPNGPNQTITPLEGIRILLSDTTGKSIDTLVTTKEGNFSAEAAEGTYILTPPDRTDEMIPGSSPSPERIVVQAGATTTVLFEYKVFAP